MACVLVHIEAEGDRPTPAALSALGEGRRIASTLGATLYAAALVSNSQREGREKDKERPSERRARRGTTVTADAAAKVVPPDRARAHRREALTKALGQAGADKVVVLSSDGAVAPAVWSTTGPALAAACDHLRPALVLFPATAGGTDIAPRLAARMGAAFVSEAVVETGSRGEIVFARTVYGGGFHRRVALDDLDRPAVVTVPTGRGPARGSDDAELLVLDVGAMRDRRVAHVGDTRDDGAALAQARVVVTGGAGVSPQSWPLVVQLAKALGGELGATRTAVARGLAPPSREVGLGAHRVSPLLYVSVGASGSPAHLGGISPDAEIVAIDKDPDASIFRVAAYGLVGTVEEMVPALIASLEKGGR